MAAWDTIAQCAATLEACCAAEEAHLVPLKHAPPALAARLALDCAAAERSGLLARAQARLGEIRRAVGTKRATNATSAAALERESVRVELAQHGLLFDFPSVVQGPRELPDDA